jgi:ferredoxin
MKNQKLTSQMVKEMALSMGADICGIGSMDRFEGAPKNSDPRYLFPEAKSVIGLAFRVHRGLYRPMEEGTHWGMYSSVGYANINDVHMPVVMRELGSFVEDYGYEAVIYNNTAVRYNANAGVPVREGYPNPSVFLHFRIAGVICGMGEIGWSNIFLTPQFGPRQRLAFIFTDAELEPDPIITPYLCDNCKICVNKCPSKAISKDESVSFELEGKKYDYAKLDEERCWVGFQCGSEETNPFLWDGSKDAELTRWMMKSVYNDDAEYLKQRQIHSAWASFDVIYEKHGPSKAGTTNFKHPGCMCGASCQRECMIHLEQQGKLENKFYNKFRIRKPWRLDPEKLLNDLYGENGSKKKDDDQKLTDYSPKK